MTCSNPEALAEFLNEEATEPMVECAHKLIFELGNIGTASALTAMGMAYEDETGDTAMKLLFLKFAEEVARIEAETV